MATKKKTTSATRAEASVLPASPTRESDQALVDQFNADGEWTLNGKPVDRESANRPAWQHTDQARALKRLEGNYETGPRVAVQSDFDRAIEHGNAAATNDMEVWETPDPLREACALVPRPDMRRRLLDPVVIKRSGMRGWKPVVDVQGNQVKVGEGILAEMPISKADARNEHYRRQGESERTAANERAQAEMEKTIRDGEAVGAVRPLQTGEGGRDGSFPVIGHTRHRGNSHFPDAA